MKRLISFLLSVTMLLSVASFSVYADNDTELADYNSVLNESEPNDFIQSIEMIKAPNKTAFEQGELITPEGAVLRIQYINDTYEDVTIGAYDYICGCNVYIKRFNAEFPIIINKENIEKESVYFIELMDYSIPVDITINSREIQIILIQNNGNDLEITAVYNGGEQKTFTALGFRTGLGDRDENTLMWGGNLITDNGIFDARIVENIETGEFYVKWLIGEEIITSNTLDNCPWWTLQQRIEKVANASSAVSNKEFNGEITSENIDDLINIAIFMTDLQFDNSACVGDSVFRADSIKIAFYDTFGVIPNLTLSSNYNAKDKTYKANDTGNISYGYKIPFSIEYKEDEIKVKVDLYSFTENNTEYITFDKDLYVKNYSFFESENFVGDVDGDGEITVTDVTAIQFHIAKVTELSGDNLSCADTDKDGDISVNDVTKLQFYIAKLI